MEKRRLGNGGLEISALSLGCMGYGKARELQDRTQMIALIRKAVGAASISLTLQSRMAAHERGDGGRSPHALRDQVKIATRPGWTSVPTRACTMVASTASRPYQGSCRWQPETPQNRRIDLLPASC
jgi:hypothetical protein